ncbi:hypothetical protein L596_017371 [Steinernema carpocapsae]|uniref:Uncharacterized protein n=1 Tax=Steinernema carpocapsae TaxID=34508 RepID=A0A4U5N1G9_STECR|nr:hypothetical protein L596_017371 [Steinernema carpocapsae]
MQKQMQEKLKMGKKYNIFAKDKNEIVSWATELFQTLLKPFSSIKNSDVFLVTYSEDWEQCTQMPSEEKMESALCLVDEKFSEKQKAISNVYKTIQNWALAAKKIKVDKCLKDFVANHKNAFEAANLDPEEVNAACLSELEYIGITKPFGPSDSTSIKLLHLPELE